MQLIFEVRQSVRTVPCDRPDVRNLGQTGRVKVGEEMKIGMQDISEGRCDERGEASLEKKPMLCSVPHTPKISCVT